MNNSINLEPEIICGHLVTAETKKLWNVLLDLFDQVDRICQKHRIRYFAGAGTLLGAVRHKGFIPWDDDMDIYMLTEDYLKFCEVAPSELSEPYFLQTYKASDVYWPDLTLLRRSDTTGCTERGLEGYIPPANMGIFIDIFPVTNIPSKKIPYALHTVAIKAYRKAFRGHERFLHAKFTGEFSWKIYLDSTFWAWKFMSLFSRNYQDLCDKFIAVLVNVKDSGLIGLKSYSTNNIRCIYKKEWFAETVMLPFENRIIPCPKMYDQLLTQMYGDYMKFVKNDSLHTYLICDTDTPYNVKLVEYWANNDTESNTKEHR